MWAFVSEESDSETDLKTPTESVQHCWDFAVTQWFEIIWKSSSNQRKNCFHPKWSFVRKCDKIPQSRRKISLETKDLLQFNNLKIFLVPDEATLLETLTPEEQRSLGQLEPLLRTETLKSHNEPQIWAAGLFWRLRRGDGHMFESVKPESADEFNINKKC